MNTPRVQVLATTSLLCSFISVIHVFLVPMKHSKQLVLYLACDLENSEMHLMPMYVCVTVLKMKSNCPF